MKQDKNRLVVIVLFLAGFLSLYHSVSQADLNKSIRENYEISVSSEGKRRLEKYDHLINYFCNIPYYRNDQVVSPAFMKALILAESAGIYHARSEKNALGLTQIRLETGKVEAKKLFDAGFDFAYIDEYRLRDLQPDDLFDPAINILLACSLISQYNVQFRGRLDMVLSAWNAGPYSNALRNNRPVQYTETEDFIGKVNGYYRYFLRLIK